MFGEENWETVSPETERLIDPPKETNPPPVRPEPAVTVNDELVNEELLMFEKVLSEPDMVLLVNISAEEMVMDDEDGVEQSQVEVTLFQVSIWPLLQDVVKERPSAPAGPVAPAAPAAPVNPWSPLSPLSPLSPGSPLGPPAGPAGPVEPAGPAGP